MVEEEKRERNALPPSNVSGLMCLESSLDNIEMKMRDEYDVGNLQYILNVRLDMHACVPPLPD
jgi:hypothetical protein